MATSSRRDPTMNTLFRRCVQCPPEAPACPPSCPANQFCQQVSASCDTCAHTVCSKIGSLPGQLAPAKHSTPVGPIVGGVIGGVGIVVLGLFALWWFKIRPKKRNTTPAWNPPEMRDRSTLRAGDRRSTTSARSMASSAMTRASNVIQIAYIPGVTVRSPPDSPGVAPPMPPWPSTGSSASSPAPEQHFFMPSDLRDSTWSDATSVRDTRISLSPSLARSTYYGEAQVVPPVPAQQAFRAQAAMVSVKSGASTPNPQSMKSPPVPQMPTPKMINSNSSIVARNMMARPVEIKKAGSTPRVPTLANLAKASKKSDSTSTGTSETSIPVFLDEKEVATPSEKEVVSPSQSQMDVSTLLTKPSINTIGSARSSSLSAILPSDGPLGSGNSTTHRHSRSEGLNALIQEAINRARDPTVTARPELKQHDSGPFSDANEVKENYS